MGFPEEGIKSLGEVIEDLKDFTILEFLNYCIFDKFEVVGEYEKWFEGFKVSDKELKLKGGIREKFSSYISDKNLTLGTNIEQVGDCYIGLMIALFSKSCGVLKDINKLFDIDLIAPFNEGGLGKIYHLFEREADVTDDNIKTELTNKMGSVFGSVDPLKAIVYMYDIELLGENLTNIKVEKWGEEGGIMASEGRNFAKSSARKRQMDFMVSLKNILDSSIDDVKDNVDIDLKINVKKGSSFMGNCSYDYELVGDLKSCIKQCIKQEEGGLVESEDNLNKLDNADFEKIKEKIMEKLSGGTEIIDAENWKPDTTPGTREGRITIINSTAQNVYNKLKKEKYITYIADFGNALHAGGGILQGANAQEESLFQSYPELFPSLASAQSFYDENNEEVEKMASSPEEMRRAAKALAKKQLASEMASGTVNGVAISETLKNGAAKALKEGDVDVALSTFFATIRGENLLGEINVLEMIVNSEKGKYADNVVSRAKEIIKFREDCAKDKDYARKAIKDMEKSGSKFVKQGKGATDRYMKVVRKMIKDFIEENNIPVESTFNMAKELEDRIKTLQEKENDKVKEYSKKLVRKYGFKRIIHIAPKPKIEEVDGAQVEVNGPGLIVINAPDLRNQVKSMDKKIADDLVAWRIENKDAILSGAKTQEEIDAMTEKISGNVLKEYQEEIGNIVDESLTGQIGASLDSIVGKMDENKKYAVILGAVGCGVFKCDPNVVSKIFEKVLKENGYAKKFDKVVFAIKEKGDTLAKAFSNVTTEPEKM